MIGVDVRARLSSWKVVSQAGVHSKVAPFLVKLCRGRAIDAKIVDKSAVIARQAAESAHFGDIARRGPGSNGCYFIGIALNVVATHNMSKKRDFALEQAALGRLQFQSVTIKPIKDSSEAIEMLIKGVREDEYVIQIDQTHIISQARHNQFHDARELAGTIGKTKAEDLKAPLPFSRDKSCLIPVALVYPSASNRNAGHTSRRIRNRSECPSKCQSWARETCPSPSNSSACDSQCIST